MTAAPDLVLVIMGVSGSGKSTVAAEIVARTGWDFQEGDDLHPAGNVEKMAGGHPLDDDDRAPWLSAVASWIRERTDASRPGIVTCSALRRRYRDVLRQPGVVFVYLESPKVVLEDRLEHRPAHFMGPALLDSQIEALEPPDPDERSLLVESVGSAAENAEVIIRELGLRPL